MTYLKYFAYLINHKHNVGIECLKMGLFVHAITHDLSKFFPSEFFCYARHFYGTPKDERQAKIFRKKLSRGWLHHQNRNKHHWNYWVDSDGNAHKMPTKYIKQMVADWRGMSRKFGDTAQSYYEKNKDTMNLHDDTALWLEYYLFCR